MAVAEFGTCCSELRGVLSFAAERTTFVDEAGTLRIRVGYVPTQSGPGWFDMALLHCPFCGERLQDRDAIPTLRTEH